MLTPVQMRIAARMCDERKGSLDADSTEDEVEAPSWLFDNGILYLGTEGCELASSMLRKKADELEEVSA